MAAVSGQVGERLGHERCTKPMLLGDRLDHELEEAQLIGRRQRVIEVPVDLELTVGVLMVVLVRTPSERNHGRADLGRLTSKRRITADWS